jgi:hypothetical protein
MLSAYHMTDSSTLTTIYQNTKHYDLVSYTLLCAL